MLCDVFSSRRKADTYLYLPVGADFNELPEPLQQQFGQPVKVMTVNLEKRQQLARVTSKELMRHLQEPGYYLQLPPQKESLR